MKKLLSILCFACFMFAGSQLSFAQTTIEQQKTAIKNADDSVKKNTQKVINALERGTKLDATQKNKVYDIFVAVDKKMKGIESIEDATERKAKQAKLQDYINQKLKQVLSQDQYELYMKKLSGKQ